MGTDNGAILDVEATRSIRQAEVGSVRTVIDRVNDTFGIAPERLIADTARGYRRYAELAGSAAPHRTPYPGVRQVSW
ncbi:hypothetical protein [Allosediminivita pacifica]|uniref:hypothetical protein n=1 Tax=Allosediminivita pacifica TaxID=1267769 RepID=UPI003CC9721F